ncbi:MAG: TraB/GumN family protein [Bacteroidota bacterium]
MKNKLLIILFFSVVGSSWLCRAQEQQSTERSSLLWKIESDTMETPSYLFGTMHLIPREKFFFPDTLDTLITHSDQLVMEIGGLDEQMKAMKLMMLDSGNVFDYFTEAQRDSLFDFSQEKLGYNEEQMRAMFGKMKPMVLLQMMTKQAFGESPASYEMKISTIAKQNEIPVAGLETVEEQVGIFDQLSMEEQVQMVMETMADTSGNEQMERMIEMYLEQDIDELFQFTRQAEFGGPSFEDDFILTRNKNWIPQLIALMNGKKQLFVAVGAAHLGGEKGVVQLLRESGFKLTPVHL